MNGVTQVSEHMFEIGGNGIPEIPESAPTTVTVKPRRATAPAVASTGSATDVRALLAQLRARLRDVKRELKAKKALEQEREQLQRLIKAATTELDNVRRLRATG